MRILYTGKSPRHRRRLLLMAVALTICACSIWGIHATLTARSAVIDLYSIPRETLSVQAEVSETFRISRGDRGGQLSVVPDDLWAVLYNQLFPAIIIENYGQSYHELNFARIICSYRNDDDIAIYIVPSGPGEIMFQVGDKLFTRAHRYPKTFESLSAAARIDESMVIVYLIELLQDGVSDGERGRFDALVRALQGTLAEKSSPP